ncbi:MAG: fructose-6-phosphate aldolase [Armatimonadetes bacterium]|nr:fructose-6-phosphate aldolase [Armatimonadota bacterium]
MKFFLDTANVEQIRQAAAWGILDGVTTNPTLVAREGRDFEEVVREICSIVSGPVSAEVTALDAEGMIEQARSLASWAPNIVVKIPVTPEGIKAVKVLSSEGIKCNVTLCFSPMQALLAAKAGAAYISPFVGRLDDVGHDGMQLVEQILTIYRNYGFQTEVIVASVRTVQHVLRAALMGAHIATVPFAVMEQLFKHHMTDIGLKAFLADWERLQEQLRKQS